MSRRKKWLKFKRPGALKLDVYFGDLFVFNVYMSCDQHTLIDSCIEVKTITVSLIYSRALPHKFASALDIHSLSVHFILTESTMDCILF